MFIIYDLIFLLFALLYSPIYLYRRKFHRGFLSRLGFLSLTLKLNNPIWIHAVSVGEIMAVRGLIDGLRKTYPQRSIVISTVTSTGNKIARDFAKESDFVTYLPLDLSFIVNHVLNKIKPSLFIIAETEIWPNLITQLGIRKVPVFIVNGRISDRAFVRYRTIKLFIKPILSKISIICAQSDVDAKKFHSLGMPLERIKVTGNLKFDSAIVKQDTSIFYKNRERLGLAGSDKVLVCGSTHQGEEEQILDIYEKLLKEFANLKLLIAPRHPERSKEVAKIISRFGFLPVFVSRLPFECSTCFTRPIYILDTIGELVGFYGIADIVFMGASLVKKGGHNILEPAFLKKPILFGPHMFNFRDIAELFLFNNAAILINDSSELEEKIRELCSDERLALQFGQNASNLVMKNMGSTKRCIELITTLSRMEQ